MAASDRTKCPDCGAWIVLGLPIPITPTAINYPLRCACGYVGELSRKVER